MSSLVLAAVDVNADPGMSWFLWWLVAFGSSLTGLYFAYKFYQDMKASDPGDANMQKIAGYVAEGAKAYLNQQYRVVAIVFLVIAAILAFMAFGLGAMSPWVPLAFLSGGFFSTLSGYFGMMTATAASNRTAAAAKKSLNEALQVSFRSGAVMGLSVVGLGLFNISIWFLLLYAIAPKLGFQALPMDVLTSTLLAAGLGASTQALFARVGGGIFTKAADVGADLVGKVESGIPEDDPRNPATIADNVGDNVGDVAGMGADLFESYCGSILAAGSLAVPALAGMGASYVMGGVILPFAIAGIGILVSIFGVYLVETREGASQQDLLASLRRGMNTATYGGIGISFLLTLIILGFNGTAAGLAISTVVGALSGILIARWTEYATSDAFGPTQRIADQAEYGPATVIISGLAEGMQSTWMPTIVVGIGTIIAYGAAAGFDFSDPTTMSMGLYGIALAAVGMLATLGILLATDAYGPIADNAGGNAEMTHQDPSVREKTDALDKLGNTTAAIGKGFAIGSAALTALALIAAYIEEIRLGYENMGKAKIAQYESLDKASSDYVNGLPVRGENPEKYTGPRVVVRKDTSVADAVSATYLRFAKDPNAEKVEYRYVAIKSATIRDLVDALDINPMNPKLLIGVMVGSMLVFVFCAMTMNAVGRSAGKMVAEVRRQFREIKGIMEGTAEPDYAACVRISTQAAQYEMLAPAILGLVAPIAGGVFLGVAGVIGILVGATATGFSMAIMMANAGGAWDNAKKYIEGGAHGGKGSNAHKAGVVGDTVGDPFKDTSGPSLNILIKLMSMVSVVFAAVVLRFGL